MENPLLIPGGLPHFEAIRPHHILPAIEAILNENRQAIDLLLSQPGPSTWANLVQPMEDLADRLARAWSPVSHLNAVKNSEDIREAYNRCLKELSAYTADLGQNSNLYRAYRAIAASEEYLSYTAEQKRVIDNTLRDFRLSGVALPEVERRRYKEIVEELALLTSKFEQNLLDATNAWSRLVTRTEDLAGVPEMFLAMFRQTALQRGQDGMLLTLEFPCYLAVMTYAEDRELRYEIYEAFVTRASDEGPHAGRWDNGPIMERILALRHEEARLLGFANYAERSLETKMASGTGQVMEFLRGLSERSLPMAKREFEELCVFASTALNLDVLQAWDVLFCSERMRQDRYSISQEALKPYFPLPKVLEGMFEVVRRLYGVQVRERFDVERWDDEVRYFEIFSSDSGLKGGFYLDPFARPNKRGGAWMDECVVRRVTSAGVQAPVAYLTCNFSPPVAPDPALLTHEEVLTLFHEFGHGLHHMLTRVDYYSISGIQGVAWDAVELPSQIMENWCWAPEAIRLFSGHYKTGEGLPEEMFEKLLAARNFQSGMKMVRQLELAIFDFRVHLEFEPDRGGRIFEILDEVRREVAVVHPPAFNRFPHSFSHIFASGYAAGYYSYKWAEVLSSDAYSLFEEKGIFSPEIGARFLSAILERGGARDPMELFIDFRGREPQIDALLRHHGIAS